MIRVLEIGDKIGIKVVEGSDPPVLVLGVTNLGRRSDFQTSGESTVVLNKSDVQWLIAMLTLELWKLESGYNDR